MCDRISVIVPVYNAGRYLKGAIDSVLSQPVSLELILVDDGSTDGSGAICDTYAAEDSRVRVIHTENRGVSCARNAGLDAATGDYFAFLDADDALLPDALLTMYKLLSGNQCDIAVCTKRSYRTDGSFFQTEYPAAFMLWSGKQGLEASLRDHPATYSVWGKLFRRDAIGDVRFVPGRKIHEDSFFIFECMLKEPKVVVQNTPVIRYNISENSASRSDFSDKYLDILFFAEQKREQILAQAPEFSALAENVMVKAHMALLKKLTFSTDPRFKAIEHTSLQYVRSHRRAFISAGASDTRLYLYILLHLYYLRKILIKGELKMKKTVLLVLCGIMLFSLAACAGTKTESPGESASPQGSEVENTNLLDNNISDTNNMIAVETSIGKLYYPAKWADDVRFDVGDQQVTASCGDVQLFTLYFGGETGNYFGMLKQGDTETELRYAMYDLDTSREDIDTLSAMQDDINVIFQYLIQDGVLIEEP